MTFLAYKEYKNSGVEWLGKLPANWDVFPLKAGFNLMKRPPPENCGVVTAFRDGEVTLRSNRRMDGFTEALQEIGYQGVEPNDLVIHAMDAFAGAIGVSDSKGKSTPVYSVCEPKKDYFSRYYGLVLRHIALAGFIQSLAKGIRERSTDFRWSDAKNIPIPHPSIEEQKSIIYFLDHETSKIDSLIAEQEKLIDLLKIKLDSLVLESFRHLDTQIIKVRNVVEVIQRPVNQAEDQFYEPLGLFNRGRGLFHKEKRIMSEMGDSDFFWIKEGDLIISGQFAWEGAVALAYEEEEDCVVSHRYPVIRGKKNIALTEYLFALLTTDHGNFLLNQSSVGAAGRNRPLNIKLLLKQVIPVPNIKTQEKIAELVLKRRNLLREIQEQTKLIHERRSALISAAITGQIDVRNYQPKVAA